MALGYKAKRRLSILALVVGLPLATDGSAHAMSARCTRFANQLRGRFGLPVDYAEERLSSVEAEERLRAGGLNARSAREHVEDVNGGRLGTV